MDFSYRLRQLRKRKGLTQQELSRLSGIGLSQIARYELVNRAPSVGNLAKIARALNVSMDYLAGLTKEQHSLLAEPELTPYERLLLDAFRSGGWAAVMHLGVEELTR